MAQGGLPALEARVAVLEAQVAYLLDKLEKQSLYAKKYAEWANIRQPVIEYNSECFP